MVFLLLPNASWHIVKQCYISVSPRSMDIKREVIHWLLHHALHQPTTPWQLIKDNQPKVLKMCTNPLRFCVMLFPVVCSRHNSLSNSLLCRCAQKSYQVSCILIGKFNRWVLITKHGYNGLPVLPKGRDDMRSYVDNTFMLLYINVLSTNPEFGITHYEMCPHIILPRNKNYKSAKIACI